MGGMRRGGITKVTSTGGGECSSTSDGGEAVSSILASVVDVCDVRDWKTASAASMPDFIAV